MHAKKIQIRKYLAAFYKTYHTKFGYRTRAKISLGLFQKLNQFKW